MAEWTFEIDGQIYDIAKLRKLIERADANPHRVQVRAKSKTGSVGGFADLIGLSINFIEVLVNRIEELEDELKDAEGEWNVSPSTGEL